MSKEKNRVEELISEGLLETAIPFIEFLKKYYEFMELGEYSPSSVINRDQIVRNVENTTATFLQRIYTEVGSSFYLNKENTEDDVANLLQNLRLVYEAKGSLESIKVLFSIVFGEDVEVYLPKEFILKPSDGDWDVQYSFMAELVSGDPLDIVGEFVDIVSQFPDAPSQTFKVEVVRIQSTSTPNLYQIYVTKEAINVFYYDATLTFGDVEMVIKPITDTLLRTNSTGTGFEFSTTYPILSYERNTYGDLVTPIDLIVPAGASADSGDTSLNLNTTASLAAGYYLYGDSALDSGTTISSIVDSDTINLSSALIAPFNNNADAAIQASFYSQEVVNTVSSYFQPLTGTRRYRSISPTEIYGTESFVITSTTDGLKKEIISRPTEQITKLYYDGQQTRITDKGDGKVEISTFVDPTVRSAPDVLLDWDEVLQELTKVAIGESDGSLFSFFNTTDTFTLTTDSAPVIGVTVLAGTIDSATGDSGTSRLLLNSTASISVGDFIYGDSSLASGTTIASIVDNNLITLSTPLIGVMPAQDSDVVLSTQANIADSSTTLYVTDTSSLVVGDLIEGTGFDSDTLVLTIVDSAQITLDKPHNGYTNGSTLDVNNYARGDINHDGTIDLGDVDLFARRLLSRDITNAAYYWIRNEIEGNLDSTPAASVTVGDNARVRPIDLNDSDGIVEFKFQSYGQNYPTNFIGLIVPDSGDVFSGIFQSSPVSLTSGIYVDNKGFLSDAIKLQDGDFYQDFSYVIRSDNQLSQFEDILYKTVHPSGMKVFGELLAGQNVSITTDASVDVASRKNSLLNDLFSTTDSDFKTFTLDANLSGFGGDSASATESLALTTIKPVADEIEISALYVDEGYTIDDANYFNNTETITVRLNGVVVV